MDYDARQAVHLPVTDYLKLDLYLMDAHPGVKLDAFVTDLVKRWLAVEMERSALRERGQAMRGFQWKNVFYRNAKGRNAWRFVWLRFPGDDYWVRAGTYRLRDGERSLASLKPLSEQSNSV
ncbi:hypothetical protein [Pseudoduganella sp.]|uniref:hypothetical protein n=1 Tax=Pseudoduganella sp. TaxID=1880898 RepID=UPI0035ADF6A5